MSKSKNLRTVMSKRQVPLHGQQLSPARAQLAPVLHQSIWAQPHVPKKALPSNFFLNNTLQSNTSHFPSPGDFLWMKEIQIPPGMVPVVAQLYTKIPLPIQFRHKSLTVDKTLLRNMDCLCVCSIGYKSHLIKSWKITFSSFMCSVYTRAQDSCFHASE